MIWPERHRNSARPSSPLLSDDANIIRTHGLLVDSKSAIQAGNRSACIARLPITAAGVTIYDVHIFASAPRGESAGMVEADLKGLK
jgi:hypothetical protein